MDQSDPTLSRAFDYPYQRPAHSFVFDSATGAVGPLHRLDPAGRVPVLAVGSNAAPEQLARKFTRGDRPGPVPVTVVRLLGHDVVFAARLAAYGACPATFARCAGVVAHVHATWLTPAQLERMDASEGVHGARPAYLRVEVAASEVELDPIPGLADHPAAVWAYEATAGPLRLGSTPSALAAVPAERRAWPALTERAVLARLAEVLGVTDAETVALTAAADAATRDRWNDELARHT